MNAAYLMLTTAWLAGADPVPVAPAPAPAAIAAPYNGGCGGASTNCGCEDPCGKKPGFFARLCAKKKHDDCGCEQQSCNTCKPAREPKCKAPREPKHRKAKDDCCAPAPTCNNDCDSQKHGLIARSRAKKSHGDCGCESSCGSGCGTGGHGGCGSTIVAPPAGSGPPPEAVPVPPKANPTEGKTTSVPRLINVTPVVAPF